jgi:glycine cleavage system H protein
MNVYRGCAFPVDLLYDVEQDVWVRLEGEVATMGMTDPAQTRCGKFVSVHFKRVGKTIPKGKAYATIESAKWVGPFPAVLTGEILETNEAAFKRDVLIANREPYDAGWLVKVRPARLDDERGVLLDAQRAFDDYRVKIEELNINCMRCID